MSARLHPEPRAATILAFRPRAGVARALAVDQPAGPAWAPEGGQSETLNRPGLVLREIGCAIAAPILFVLMLRIALVLLHALRA
jgi:hypothetical protein